MFLKHNKRGILFGPIQNAGNTIDYTPLISEISEMLEAVKKSNLN